MGTRRTNVAGPLARVRPYPAMGPWRRPVFTNCTGLSGFTNLLALPSSAHDNGQLTAFGHGRRACSSPNSILKCGDEAREMIKHMAFRRSVRTSTRYESRLCIPGLTSTSRTLFPMFRGMGDAYGGIFGWSRARKMSDIQWRFAFQMSSRSILQSP